MRFIQKLTVVFCLLLFINQSSWAREMIAQGQTPLNWREA